MTNRKVPSLDVKKKAVSGVIYFEKVISCHHNEVSRICALLLIGLPVKKK